MSDSHHVQYENLSDKQKNRTIWSVIMASSLGTLIDGMISISSEVWQLS